MSLPTTCSEPGCAAPVVLRVEGNDRVAWEGWCGQHSGAGLERAHGRYIFHLTPSQTPTRQGSKRVRLQRPATD
jgi:hypothetical protein